MSNFTPSGDHHAVFAVTLDGRKFRVSDWTDWGTAADVYEGMRDPFQPGGTPKNIDGADVHYLAVRAGNDPNWNTAPEATLIEGSAAKVATKAASAAKRAAYVERMTAERAALPYVKLTQPERSDILHAARKFLRDSGHEAGYGIDDAATFIATEIDKLETFGGFGHLEYATISDYAWAAARFVCPREAKENW